MFSRRLRQRYWHESTFKGVEMVRSALDEAYGTGKVSLVSAAFPLAPTPLTDETRVQW